MTVHGDSAKNCLCNIQPIVEQSYIGLQNNRGMSFFFQMAAENISLQTEHCSRGNAVSDLMSGNSTCEICGSVVLKGTQNNNNNNNNSWYIRGRNKDNGNKNEKDLSKVRSVGAVRSAP